MVYCDIDWNIIGDSKILFKFAIRASRHLSMLLPVIFRFRGYAVSYTDFLSACASRDIIIRGNRINLASVDQRFSKHRRIIYADDARQGVGNEVVIHECRDVNPTLQLKFYIFVRPRDFFRRILDDSLRSPSILNLNALHRENLRGIDYSREPRCV